MASVDDTAVALVWVAWLLYWAWSARGVKAPAREDSMGSQLLYRVPMVLAFVILFMHGPRTSEFYGRFLPASPAWWCVGMLVLLCGLGFACWARVVLGRNWSADVQVKQDHELVQQGPYRWVRHPIYTGMLLGLAGTALALGQWRDLLALALVAGSFWYKLRHEERWMREVFGAVYEDYMRRTKALIPWLL
ncbi:isoprenylcysteine carboxylmethyltransferase family protein [Dyella sp. A6]|uniref:methyltransferase family protein n=1 Tax=Dyella aluminiiresistens TaxID=3069105 RepID=UPI002E7822B3|nr:isoprenylcysteine carboxylmethyltransferase family protein [Dyella sp. A6]